MNKQKKCTLYGVQEIALALGARRQTVSMWLQRDKLPDPDQRLSMGPVWFAETIEPWISARAKEAA